MVLPNRVVEFDVHGLALSHRNLALIGESQLDLHVTFVHGLKRNYRVAQENLRCLSLLGSSDGARRCIGAVNLDRSFSSRLARRKLSTLLNRSARIFRIAPPMIIPPRRIMTRKKKHAFLVTIRSTLVNLICILLL